MAQAWHKGDTIGFAQSIQGLSQPPEMQHRRASAYRYCSYESDQPLEYDASRHGTKTLWDLLSHVDGGIEASPEAVWTRADPFRSYRPVSASREPEAGAHLDFMNTRRAWERHGPDEALRFANKHGLLGLFYERFSGPILPAHTSWVTPNAGFTKEGRLREVDPATDGKRHLEELLSRRRSPNRPGEKVRLERGVALPHELKFLARTPLAPFGFPQAVSEAFESEVVGWEEVKEIYGCYVVPDRYSNSGITILSTREPLFWWENELENFPSEKHLKAEYGFSLGTINRRIAGNVSPRGYVNERGQAERGWRCPSLLKALYLMLYLDLTGGRGIRKCGRSDCQNHYRAGPQSNSKYCSTRCANAASTRKGRGQEP